MTLKVTDELFNSDELSFWMIGNMKLESIIKNPDFNTFASQRLIFEEKMNYFSFKMCQV